MDSSRHVADLQSTSTELPNRVRFEGSLRTGEERLQSWIVELVSRIIVLLARRSAEPIRLLCQNIEERSQSAVVWHRSQKAKYRNAYVIFRPHAP